MNILTQKHQRPRPFQAHYYSRWQQTKTISYNLHVRKDPTTSHCVAAMELNKQGATVVLMWTIHKLVATVLQLWTLHTQNATEVQLWTLHTQGATVV